MERLIAIIDSDDSTVAEWLVLDANGNRHGDVQPRTALSDLAGDAAGRQLVVLLPGWRIRTTELEMPTSSLARQMQALPYAAEERFGQPPEELHFAMSRDPQSKTVITAAACDAAWLSSTVARLEEHGLKPSRLVPDYLALPWRPGSWTVLETRDWLYVRYDWSLGFALEKEMGRSVLKQWISRRSETDLPKTINWFCCDDDPSSRPELPTVQDRIQWETAPGGLTELVPRGFADETPMNLLQGQFKPGREWRRSLYRWLPTGIAAAACLVLFLAYQSVSYMRAKQSYQHYHHAVLTQFHRLLPGQPVEDIRIQIRQLLQQQSGQQNAQGLLPLLDVVAQILPGSPVQLNSITYQNDRMQLSLHAKSVHDLESLKQILAKQGHLRVTLQSANSTHSGVSGTVNIQRPTP